MKRLKLTDKEKSRLEKMHDALSEKKRCDRIKAILLRSEGWRVTEIAQALRIHTTTVTRHINDYRAGKLNASNGGSSSKLTDEQTSELINHLETHTYHYTHEIVFYVKATYRVEYSVPGMNKWLHHNGFSYKKPTPHPAKFDETKQTEFVESYKELKANLGKNEAILFMDAVHPTQNTKLGYGWIRTGKEKAVKTSASRSRMNIVGAIELGHLSKTVTSNYKTINEESIVAFLKQLRESRKDYSTLHLILDQAGYHRSDLVKETAKKCDIKLHYLPPYSPNLNPIERLWKVMNERVRNNKFFETATAFRKTIEGFFKNILPDIADSLNSRINDKFQILKHAS